MRVALIHSFYSSQQPSGENQVVLRQAELLQEAGHEVRVIGRSTDSEALKRLYSLKTAIKLVSGRDDAVLKEIDAFSPEVIHIHNLFPNVGTRWILRCSVPKVISLHNYRAYCSPGTFFRDGTACIECVDHGSLRAIKYGCYRDSRVATAPVAASRHLFRNHVLRSVDLALSTSEASDQLMRGTLGDIVSIQLLPNPGSDSGLQPRAPKDRHGWIAAGRFSPEKGFEELIRDWPMSVPLTILGAGDAADPLLALARSKPISIRPSVSIANFRNLLPQFTGFVFPSLWFEVAPQVVVEALRVGLPVIVHKDNTVANLVEKYGFGLSYSSSSDLQTALAEVAANCETYSSRAYNYYAQNLRPGDWTASISNIYAALTRPTNS